MRYLPLGGYWVIKTTERILTEACVELALVLTERTSELLNTENQALRFRIKQAISETCELYTHLLTRID